MGSWTTDLALGNLAELEFGELLTIRKPGHLLKYNMTSAWDVEYNGVRFECKHDLQTDVTGNIVVEFERDEQPSGIEVTEAKYWAVKAMNQWSIAPTDVVRNYMREYPVVPMGDGLRTKGYLIPFKDYLEWCSVKFGLDGKTIKGVD